MVGKNKESTELFTSSNIIHATFHIIHSKLLRNLAETILQKAEYVFKFMLISIILVIFEIRLARRDAILVHYTVS